MSKLSLSIVLCGCFGISSVAFANWQDDCRSIDGNGVSQKACATIQAQVSALQQFAPPKSFHDLSISGSSYSPAGGAGGTGGSSDVLSSDHGNDSNGSSSHSNENSNDSGTFQ